MEVSREHINAAATSAYERTVTGLTQRRSPEACVEICRGLAGAIDEKVAALTRAGAAIACAPGCAFCCHLRVSAFPHEAVALWTRLRALGPEAAAVIGERILRNAARIERLTAAEHYAARIPCAFLVDGRCSVHDARPSACAAYHSMSRARCEHAYEHPERMGTPSNSRPALAELQTFGSALIEATKAALDDAGVSSAQGELHRLLRALIEEPAAAERWLAASGAPAGGDTPTAAMKTSRTR
jgi:hypothetical protein